MGKLVWACKNIKQLWKGEKAIFRFRKNSFDKDGDNTGGD